MKTDIEIAQSAKLKPITQIAESLGIDNSEIEQYGHFKAKISNSLFERIEKNKDGKLVLVTAVNPTPAGEGKTTVSIGLSEAMNLIGKKTTVALREPSLGPVFGIKGGAAGGGYSQVVPMEDINLHFTGDMHAITSANNLMCAILDNHIQQGNELGIDPRRILAKRCMDINDRVLRNIVVGMGGALNGVVREDHFIITVASEVMAILCLANDVFDLKTRVSAALPYYERFLAALPDIPALAACEEEKLHKLWEGLGYYSRVRNLQKAARIVCEQYGGQLPADYDALRALPGIGDYTAGAIASISFGLAVPAVDGNVLRVFSRLYNDPGVITEPAVKRAFTARVMEHQPPEKAGDYNQALMELGALVCVPNGAPLCEQCPLASLCEARRAGTALELPHKAAPKARRIEPVTVVLAEDAEERFLLQQRPQKGLLAGLWQPLLWEGEALSAEEVCARLEALGLACEGIEPLPAAKHIFSHIEWRMSGYSVCVGSAEAPTGCVWASREQLQNEYTLPGAFKAYKKKLGL